MFHNTYRSGSETHVTSFHNLRRDLFEQDRDVAQKHEEMREVKARKVEEEAQSANVVREAVMAGRGENTVFRT